MNRMMIFAFALLAFALGASTLRAGETGPNAKDSTAKLLQYLDDKKGYVRAAAIDHLGARKANEAIPKLRALLSDGTALAGSGLKLAPEPSNVKLPRPTIVFFSNANCDSTAFCSSSPATAAFMR